LQSYIATKIFWKNRVLIVVAGLVRHKPT
jgi:hypothetical protein